jgi:hypothetical protein
MSMMQVRIAKKALKGRIVRIVRMCPPSCIHRRPFHAKIMPGLDCRDSLAWGNHDAEIGVTAHARIVSPPTRGFESQLNLIFDQSGLPGDGHELALREIGNLCPRTENQPLQIAGSLKIAVKELQVRADSETKH